MSNFEKRNKNYSTLALAAQKNWVTGIKSAELYRMGKHNLFATVAL